MGNKNDPTKSVELFEREIEAIESGDWEVHEADKTELLAFGEHLFSEKAPSTARTQLQNVRRVCVRAKEIDFPPLTEWAKVDFDRYVGRLKRGSFPDAPEDGWSEGTVRNRKQHLKNFFDYMGREWAEDITVGSPPDTKVRHKDLLTQEETQAIFDVTEHPRDQCLVALPLATFQRVGALISLRIKDVHLNGDVQTGYITLNEDAHGLKGARGKRPLTWATAYVKDWLQVHPRKDDDEAPVLCVTTNSGRATKGDALTIESYNSRLRTLAERAGLEEDRWKRKTGRSQRTIGVHLLRHTGLTRAATSSEFSDQILKKWAGWTPNSRQLENYMHINDDQVLEAAAEVYGDEEAETELAKRPNPDSCPQCGHATETWMKACPNCTLLLTPEVGDVATSAEDLQEDATETALDPEEDLTPEEREGLKAMLKAVDDPAALATKLAALGED